MKNILDLKMDKLAAGIIERVSILLETLNFFSSRSASFTAPVREEGSINPFFKLLDSPDKNAKVP
jgi:hypothetical protein